MARRTFGQRLGERLRVRREMRGLSQAKVAELAHLSPNFIGLLERGEKLPALDTLVGIAKALEVEPGELLGPARPADDWIDEVSMVAAAVPKQLRPLALAVLRAFVTKS